MIYRLIEDSKNKWIQSDDCAVKDLLAYIQDRGELRDAQIRAIETYLFLKLRGENKPLAQLFKEGLFFDTASDLSGVPLTERAREVLKTNPAALSLYLFACMAGEKGEPVLPELRDAIASDPDGVDYDHVIDAIFYGIQYPDYLFSLPMGAGKTFVIAALIYLDLYFALREPENPLFAHNFLVLIPSGLLSSIVPSLKTIERFDPSWVLPEPAAANIRRMLRFEVLDQPKSARKSNRARNPNSQKVNAAISEPNPMGVVFVVNAEKVILDRLDLSENLVLIEKTDDERDRSANELRHLIGKIPRLGIHIDEVHHATKDDIKLRQVVTGWYKGGSVVTVAGYSGTPYLSGAETIQVNGSVKLTFRQITNTVYYYPLIVAIRRFLKKPEIRTGKNLVPLEIIRRGVTEFYEKYGSKVYGDGTQAKLAIYCGSIDRLEGEIYPFLRNELGIPDADILPYHTGNKEHPVRQGAEAEFALLDTPASQKRIVLLVQIGKEGWDWPVAHRGDPGPKGR